MSLKGTGLSICLHKFTNWMLSKNVASFSESIKDRCTTERANGIWRVWVRFTLFWSIVRAVLPLIYRHFRVLSPFGA